MKICAVTGATGTVGRNLIDELLKDGWDITVLHRKTSDLSRLDGCKVRFQETDLFDLERLRRSLAPGLDAVFHVAGNTSHWSRDAEQQWKDNVLATRNLVQAALEKKTKRFIFTSTGATNSHQFENEAMAERIEEGYVRTKRLAEIEVFKGVEKGLDAVILKPAIVVGAYDYDSYSKIFKMLKSGPVKLIFPGKAVFCHARSVARAHVSAFEKGRSGEYYCVGGPFTTWLDFAQRISRAMGVPPLKRAVPYGVLLPLSYAVSAFSFVFRVKPPFTPNLIRLLKDSPGETIYDKRKSRLDLGYESASLDEMIQDCYRWLVKENRI